MDIREVRHQSNPLNEPQDKDPKPLSLCPNCSSTVLDGDRFCQECGARVTANRAKKAALELLAREQASARDDSENARGNARDTGESSRNARDKSEVRETQFTANILCINCGAKNSPVSVDCNFCKKALVPDSGERTGRKTFLRDFLVQEKPQRRRFGKNTAERLPALKATRFPGTEIGVYMSAARPASETVVATKQRIPRAFAASKTSDASKTAAISTRGTAAPETEREDDLELLFCSSVSEDEEWQPQSKKDRIAAEKVAYERPRKPDPSFSKLMIDSGADGFSLTAIQLAVEAFFERVPVPILLFVASMVIIFTTVHLTTEWHRQEQRLTALDKLASHAEDDMKAYKLDDAVIAMTELEKTERGNLPPRARSVLNQSLWLRAYAYAAKNRYDLAVEDMKRVTPTFNAFADASEKLDEYKEELRIHPEYAAKAPAPAIGPDSASKSSLPDKTPPARLDESNDKVSGKSPKSKTTQQRSERPAKMPTLSNEGIPQEHLAQERRGQINDTCSESKQRSTAQEKSSAEERNSQPSAGEHSQAEQRSHQAKKGKAPGEKGDVKEGKINPVQDPDSKRYGNLLIKYFSEAHDSEPPSFEEWESSGKKDF